MLSRSNKKSIRLIVIMPCSSILRLILSPTIITFLKVSLVFISERFFCITVGDSAYLYSVGFNWNTGLDEISYALIDIKSEKVLSKSFIADGTESLIKLPYGIAVNPNNKEIFVTDAGDYVSPGTLYCFDKTGHLKWKQTTGDIPAHIEFTFK